MKAIAINGSPRKRWNTATLLRKALAGAKAKGAKTELVHLYDLTYKGCISCFACKKIGGKSYGRCAVKDELTPVLTKAAEAEVLILGSPMYFHTKSGEMRSFSHGDRRDALFHGAPPVSVSGMSTAALDIPNNSPF
jgi:multimeric flavodoxin WrbA